MDDIHVDRIVIKININFISKFWFVANEVSP